MVVVKVAPPGQSDRGWRMKPGDKVEVDWPDGVNLTVHVDDAGAVVVSGVPRPPKDGDEVA